MTVHRFGTLPTNASELESYLNDLFGTPEEVAARLNPIRVGEMGTMAEPPADAPLREVLDYYYGPTPLPGIIRFQVACRKLGISDEGCAELWREVMGTDLWLRLPPAEEEG